MDFILSDTFEAAIVILGACAAIVGFVTYGNLNGVLVPVKRIYFVSFGFVGMAISALFFAVLINEPTLTLIALNRVVWAVTLTLTIIFCVDVLRLKNELTKRTE